jgi:cbb3-type cytochrome oxidase maturation protein
MEILFVLIPLSVLLVAVAIGAFVWAAHSGQFDAADDVAARVLRDDEPPP